MSMTEADALGALADSTPEAVSEPVPSQEPVGATTTDSFTSLDPSTLSPELQNVYKSMQADYTRKAQEAAPWRTTFSDLGNVDPAEARQAYEFWQNVNTDPDYAKQVYAQLGEALQPYMTAEPPAAELDEYANPLEAQVAQLSKQLNDMQEQQKYNAGAAELQRQEMAIRASNPTWTDADFSTVYELALAHNGNLMKAADQFTALQQRVISNYMGQKGSVSDGVQPAGRASNAIDIQEPPKTTKEAHSQAYEYLKQALGAS
jgi:chaperonin cofactor prefoldin